MKSFCHCLIQEENTKIKTKNKQLKKNPKFKCNTVSVSPSASSPSFVIVPSKEEEKKKIWRQLCECLSEAVAHLLPNVSQLLLQGLFIVGLRNELSTHLTPQALFI
jgi:hypothetical protein